MKCVDVLIGGFIECIVTAVVADSCWDCLKPPFYAYD